MAEKNVWGQRRKNIKINDNGKSYSNSVLGINDNKNKKSKDSK